MSVYVTKQGDMWDIIAHNLLNSESKVGDLLSINAEYAGIYIFPAGIKLEIPEGPDYSTPNSLPPWKQVAG